MFVKLKILTLKTNSKQFHLKKIKKKKNDFNSIFNFLVQTNRY